MLSLLLNTNIPLKITPIHGSNAWVDIEDVEPESLSWPYILAYVGEPHDTIVKTKYRNSKFCAKVNGADVFIIPSKLMFIDRP